MEKLRDYQTFKSVQEMNKNEHLVLSNVNLTEAQRDLYLLLCRHSCKFPGVSFLKVESMSKALQVSCRTVRRHLKALGDLGIIKRIRMLRIKSGGFGASLTIICPIDLSHRTSSENPSFDNGLKPFDETETINPKTISKDLNKRNELDVLDHRYVNDKFVPKEFTKLAKCFFDDANYISKLFGKIKLAAYKNNMENDSDTVLNVAVETLKTTIAQLKRKGIRNVFAYLYRVAEAKFELIYLEQLNQLNFNPELPNDHWIFA